MIIDDAHASNNGWPEWLTGIDAKLPALFERLDLAEKALTDRLPENLTYLRYYNTWFLQAQEEAILTRQITDTYFYAKLMDNAEPHCLLGQLFYVRSLVVSRQIRAARWLLNQNDFISAMTMYRGALEQSANLVSCLREVAKINPDATYADALAAHVDLYLFLKRRAHGTSIEWEKVSKLRPEELFGRKGKDGIKYEPSEGLMDRTAKNVLGDVDKLDREIPGTRTAYEILCEFLHPNVGAFLAVLESAQPAPSVPEVGTPLVEKALTSGPPVGFVHDASGLVVGLFEQFAKVFEHIVGVVERQSSYRERCQSLTQRINRQILRTNPQFKHPYLPCPCTSGKKIRFCCGVPDQSAVEPSNN